MDEAAVQALAQLIGRVNLHRDIYKLPNFAGRDTKPSSCKFEEWIYLYETKVKGNAAIAKDEKERIVTQSLIGEARARFVILEQSKTSFDDILQKFKTAYADQSSSIELIEVFHSAKQKHNETASEFADRLELHAHKIVQHKDIGGAYYTSDNVLKTTFVRGLRDESLSDRVVHLLDDEKCAFDKLRQRVVTEEERRKATPKPVKAVAEQQESPELKLALQRLKDKDRELEELRKRVQSQSRSPPQQRSRGPPRTRPHCDFCDRPNHTREQCYAYKHQQKIKSGNA